MSHRAATPDAVWTPSLGACVTPDGISFRVWAPTTRTVELLVERPDGVAVYPLAPVDAGFFTTMRPDVVPGDRYRYRLDGDRVLPDPASRFQPEGVHGPSQVVEPSAFTWSDRGWRGLELSDTILYELHVGAFSPEGTFAGATARLPALVDLGVTAIELMPVADFPGHRNWGYDGVALFAPARCYGSPDDLRTLVDTAHALGVAVILDVVYNHLGPDGAYLSAFSPYYFTMHHQTPWGAALNFDDEQSAPVRDFFIENACHWVHEYHLDGLRLDATHAIADEGPRHFLAELTARVRTSVTDRHVLVTAEDHRNLNWMLKSEQDGGWGLDAVWADAFHHQCRRLLAGDHEGYYVDYSGRTEDIATTIRQGWFYTGQSSQYLGEPRGTDPSGIPPERFIVCLQNHDQIGNRALGDRLHHYIAPAAFRAATALLLLVPETPLLFMGQEWAASTPFPYFTDHHQELGQLVTTGRRAEFGRFSAFSDPMARERIPDPQADSTFRSACLRWEERQAEPHASTLRLYRALLRLRRSEAALRPGGSFDAAALDEDTVAVRRSGTTDDLVVVTRLRGAGDVNLTGALAERGGTRDMDEKPSMHDWQVVMTTEDPEFVADVPCRAPRVDVVSCTVRFERPSAVVFRRSLLGGGA
ncbi:MAG: malto-oligosyltrehalose trehalohydrolase [Vicinamibacterales bacterium]